MILVFAVGAQYQIVLIQSQEYLLLVIKQHLVKAAIGEVKVFDDIYYGFPDV